jgi:hypothetical protein
MGAEAEEWVSATLPTSPDSLDSALDACHRCFNCDLNDRRSSRRTIATSRLRFRLQDLRTSTIGRSPSVAVLSDADELLTVLIPETNSWNFHVCRDLKLETVLASSIIDTVRDFSGHATITVATLSLHFPCPPPREWGQLFKRSVGKWAFIPWEVCSM